LLSQVLQPEKTACISAQGDIRWQAIGKYLKILEESGLHGDIPMGQAGHWKNECQIKRMGYQIGNPGILLVE